VRRRHGFQKPREGGMCLWNLSALSGYGVQPSGCPGPAQAKAWAPNFWASGEFPRKL